MTAPAAPLNRRYLDYFGTPARITGGALFVGYSAVATVRFAQQDFARVLAGKEWIGVDAGLIVGILIATIIFVGELLTAEHYKKVYAVILSVDTFYTFRLSFPWLLVLFNAEDTGWPKYLLVGAATVLIALVVAWAGEMLLFGKRRK